MPPFTRRDFLALSAAFGATCLSRGLVTGHAAPKSRPMNVLFIAVDDLRPQLGCYGHAQMISPHLDALAQSGTLFERAYCQQAVCAPSRASVLSGLRPDSTGIYDLQTPLRTVLPDVLTLPQHFKNNGYKTQSVGKIYHHGRREDPLGWSEEAVAGAKDPGYASPQIRAELEKRRAGLVPKERGKVRGPAFEAGDEDDDFYLDGQIARQSVAELRRFAQTPRQPFFLAAGFFKPHLPFVCPRRYWELYDPQKLELAPHSQPSPLVPPHALHNWGELRSYAGIPADGPLSPELARQIIHGYFAATSYADAQIGRVLVELKTLGLEQNTVVVVWGDHGYHLGDHGLWCKHSNFETAVHSPLLLRVPGLPQGARTRELVEFVDIFPTLCDAASLPKPPHLEGQSLLPLAQNPATARGKEAAFSQYPRSEGNPQVMGYSVRTGRFRYTQWQRDWKGKTPQIEGEELYDHQNDAGETRNLAGKAEFAGIVAQHKDILKK